MGVLDKALMGENVSWEDESGDQGGDLGCDPGSGRLAEQRKQCQEVWVLRSICVDVGVMESQASRPAECCGWRGGQGHQR